jgi:Zn-dependent protease
MIKIKVKFHPLFLLLVTILFYFGMGTLFWDMLFCWAIQEGGYVIFTRRKGLSVRYWLFTPLGIRADFVSANIAFDKRLRLHFIGSIFGILLSIVLFGLEQKNVAILSLLLAGLRLLPFLPLEGGRIWMEILGKWKGTLRAASWLTKAGYGVGYGLCVFGVLFSIIEPSAFLILPVGLYLIYVNRHEFLQIAKNLYTGMLNDVEKPLREVIVSGKETPFELALHMNPYEDIYFFRENQGGVSQERVMLALFTEKDSQWVWKIADQKDFGAKTYQFGYDDME